VASLTVVRHAQASLFADDYDQLSDRGVEQGGRLGQRFSKANVRFDRVVSGPARRHQHTARLALPGAEVEVIEGFDEHDAFSLMKQVATLLHDDAEIGPLLSAAASASRERRSAAWQNLFEATMARWMLGEFDAMLPGVETWPAFRDRVSEALDALTDFGASSTALFTSVGPTAVILHRVFDCAPLVAFSTAWRQTNASISRILFSPRRRDGMFSLDAFNDAAHLVEAGLVTHR
jgi:broad specificity phosphatase PhoE